MSEGTTEKYFYYQRTYQGEPTEFLICEAPTAEQAKNLEKYPVLLSFPVSQRYDADQQRKRVRTIVKWMNECWTATQVVERMSNQPALPTL